MTRYNIYDTIVVASQEKTRYLKYTQGDKIVMQRNWEEGKREPKGPARVGHYTTINAASVIVINRYTFESLGSPKAVLISFDRANATLGLKSVHPEADNAYPLKPCCKNGGKLIRAAQAANQFGIRPSGVVRFNNPIIDEYGFLLLDMRNTRSAARPRKGH